MWFYSWIRKLSMNSRFIFLFHISFFLFFHVLLGSSYVKTLRGNDNPVTISKPTPQTVVPKHHSPCKGTRATWRKSWFQAGGRKCTVQFSSSVMSDSLWPHGLQHARLPCPSSTPRAYSNSCPSSRWCHLTISSSVIPFSCPQSFPTSGSFQMSQLSQQVTKVLSFSFSISPSNEYSRLISFRMDWLDLLAVQGTLKSLLQHHGSKASILWHSAFFIVQLSHPSMTTGKTIALTRWTFVGKMH